MLMLASFVRQSDRVYKESMSVLLQMCKVGAQRAQGRLGWKGPADLKHLKLCGLHFEDS